MVNVLAVLKISREAWESIPKRDRDRIVKAVREGAFKKAREIAKAVLKPKSKSKKKATTRRRKRRKKKAEWWA